jgi:hypothetical protein
MIPDEDKRLLEQALKGHLSSPPEGGDVPPPPVDPDNITGVNKEDGQPELYQASPAGPKKVTTPMERAAFQALSRSQRQKVIDAGMAPPGVNPRSYATPTQTNASIQRVMRMPEMDLTKTREMPEMDLTGEDVVSMDGEPKISVRKRPTIEAPEESPPPVETDSGADTTTRSPLLASSPGSGPPTPADKQVASSPFQDASDYRRRQTLIAGIGEAADRAAHQPMNLADFAINRAGGHAIEQGPDTAAWNQIRADAGGPLRELAQRTALGDAKKRQAEQDALNATLKGSEARKNDAEAYKALHPEPKPPHEPPFDPLSFKDGMKKNPAIMSELRKTHPKDAEQVINSLGNDKATLENFANRVGGQGQALTLMYQGKAQDVADLPKKKEAEVAGDITKKVIEERRNVKIAKSLVPQLRDAWHQVTPAEIALYKATGTKTGALARFDGIALASIDKMTAVESGGSAKQGGINQWKHAVEDGNYTDASMDGVLSGLDTALDISDKENEASLSGLTNVGGHGGAPEKTIPFYDPSLGDLDIPESKVARFKKEHPSAKEAK